MEGVSGAAAGGDADEDAKDSSGKKRKVFLRLPSLFLDGGSHCDCAQCSDHLS